MSDIDQNEKQLKDMTFNHLTNKEFNLLYYSVVRENNRRLQIESNIKLFQGRKR